MYKHMDRYHNVDESMIIECLDCKQILHNKASLISHQRKHLRAARKAQRVVDAAANNGEPTTKRQKVVLDEKEPEDVERSQEECNN